MQNRNFGRLSLSNGTQNEGIGVILRNGVVNDVDAVIGGLFYVLYNVRVAVLRSHRLGSVKGKVRGRR